MSRSPAISPHLGTLGILRSSAHLPSILGVLQRDASFPMMFRQHSASTDLDRENRRPSSETGPLHPHGKHRGRRSIVPTSNFVRQPLVSALSCQRRPPAIPSSNFTADLVRNQDMFTRKTSDLSSESSSIMFLTSSALGMVALVAIAHCVVASGYPGVGVDIQQRQTANYTLVCSQIADSISSAEFVYYPGDATFERLSSHWAPSSSQVPTCVVEPQTPLDVSEILTIVGDTRTPFAVQGGGHTRNPGFSSTIGVHISMNGFRSIRYDPTSQTAEIGAGLRWQEVYAELEPYGVSVVGGRVPGPGVSGFTLGGGYGWRTNQFGLTLDTVTAFELVTPTGEVVTVTEISDSQLFFALRGSGNNFGIVTKFTLRTFPQGQVWGGMITYAAPDTFSAIAAAIATFSSQVQDPKASMLGTVIFYGGVVSTSPLEALARLNSRISRSSTFNCSTMDPARLRAFFDDFLGIPSVENSVRSQSWVSFINSMPAPFAGTRGASTTLAVPEYSNDFLQLVTNITFATGAELTPRSLTFMTLVAEPFVPDALSHSSSPSAYPWTRSTLYTPLSIVMVWTDETQDDVFYDALDQIKDTLEAALVMEGHEDVTTAPLYSNYALATVPLSRLYGSNLDTLREIKSRVDPSNVMGLAGGFKI
ncbi:hypothetical protein NMY22_g13470 [Coprinellus aureogranulatus]|nr:hypothetical protein NMY22_g13470 [Coprinellus aureogranulatus]